MAAGVSLDRACEVVGHRHSTTTRDVRDALRALGIGCADKCVRPSRARPNLPKHAIVNIHKPSRPMGHWMLAWDGEVFDPEGFNLKDYKDWRILSYLEIYA